MRVQLGDFRSASFEAVVARIGADGDGIATAPDGKPVYLRLTLPGERVRASVSGKRGDGHAGVVHEILSASSERTVPPCPHFGPCGGCALQHWRDDAYADWKSGQVSGAARRAGCEPVIGTLVRTPPGGRRRMDLALRRDRGAIRVGIHGPRSRDIVDITTCLVLAPALVRLIAPLRATLRGISGLRREGSAVVNLLANGPDLLLRGDAPLTTSDRQALAALAHAEGVSRISWSAGRGGPETAFLSRAPAIAFSGATVLPAPGAFLQASAEGEAAIVDAVLAGLPDKLPSRARIAELYAGSGTLTFALARRARVDAFEGDEASVAALRRGANTGGLAGRVTATVRDLAEMPLSARELGAYAAVVLDPPYAGAAAAIREIAAAKPKHVIYVSCNPAALAGDAAVLRAAGYRWTSVTPIDQFLWSARIEAVAVFAA